MRLLKFPTSGSVIPGRLATSAPDAVGYTNLFHTLRSPQPAGLYLVEVRHLDRYLNAALGVSRCGSLLDGDNASQFIKRPDKSHSYSLVVHPANAGRNADACYVGRITAWVVPGATVTAHRGDKVYLDCIFGMELTEGNSYTLTSSGGGDRIVEVYEPSRGLSLIALTESNSVGAPFQFTAPETGIYRVLVAELANPGSPVTFSLTPTDNGRDAAYFAAKQGVLVSNLGKQGGVYHQLELSDYAQSFRTGGSSGGYTLDSVDLGLKAHFLQEDVKAPKVKVVEGTAHGTVVYEMSSARDRLVGDTDEYRFYAPVGTILKSSTTYWVVVEVADSDGDDVVLITIQDPDEDTPRLSGFSIDDAYRSRYPTSTGEFQTSIRGSLKIRVIGGIPLVSNIGQAGAGVYRFTEHDYAQGFTTGAKAGGHRLTSVELFLGGAGSDLARPRVRVVSGSPHATGGIELSGPASLDATTYKSHRFTAPADTILSPSTTYYVVVEKAAVGGDHVRWRNTASTSEDTGAASGWSINDAVHFRAAESDGAFSSIPSVVLHLRINGPPDYGR